MKRILKFIGVLLLSIVLLIGAAAGYIAVSGIPTYEPGKIELKVEVTPARIERGKKLTGLLCQQCHYNPATGSLTGRLVEDAPPEFGKVYSRNITHSMEHGIGGWSDGEIAFLLRTGIKKDGSYAPPWMPKLPLMSEEDLLSIIAFLRSDDPLVKANDTPDKESEPSFLAKFLCRVAFKPLPYPEKAVLAPDTSDHVAYGRYLAVGVVDCYSCHSADFKTDDPVVPEHSVGFFGGGNAMLDINGKTILTANITPDPLKGIGNWTQEEFITAVRLGRRPDGKQLRLPMPPYVTLDSSEAASIYQYLRTVPPLSNSVDRKWK